MKILAYNPGHDGAFAFVEDGRLVFSIEAEKGSRYRHSSLSVSDAFDVLGEVQTVPDVLCRGGWWPGDSPQGREGVADYRGSHHDQVVVGKKRWLGKTVHFFSSSHERSHLLCAFGMSSLPKGTSCYALLWEGVIGAFYEIDEELNVSKVGDVMPEPGHRYAMLYAIADPTFDKSTAESPDSPMLESDGSRFVFEKKPSVRGGGEHHFLPVAGLSAPQASAVRSFEGVAALQRRTGRPGVSQLRRHLQRPLVRPLLSVR